METEAEKKAIKMPCTCCHKGEILLQLLWAFQDTHSTPLVYRLIQPCRECLYEPSGSEIHGFLTRRIKDVVP